MLVSDLLHHRLVVFVHDFKGSGRAAFFHHCRELVKVGGGVPPPAAEAHRRCIKKS